VREITFTQIAAGIKIFLGSISGGRPPVQRKPGGKSILGVIFGGRS